MSSAYPLESLTGANIVEGKPFAPVSRMSAALPQAQDMVIFNFEF